ncbi:MAG: Ig-like domain-containing protein, partial [Thermoplasmata archaeon]
EQTSLVLEDPSEVQKNERFTVSARLTNEGGNPLEDSEVIFYRITNYGKLTLGSNVTDAEGYANYSDTSYEGGIFKLEALYGGSSSYEPSNATVEIATLGDEEPEPFLIGGVPLEILIVVNIVVVGVWMTFGYVLYQLYRIRKAGKEEWELEES